MRIASVESWVGGSLHVVRITDEAGVTGLGQSGCWAYPHATEAVVAEFRKYLVGSEADRIADHWYSMHRMGPFRGAVVSAALSAIDVALWDLKAKNLGAPVFELLGGRVRDRVRLHKLILGWSTLEDLAVEVATAVKEGFTAVKFDPVPAGHSDVSLPELAQGIGSAAETARDQAGDSMDLILELHRSLTPHEAQTVFEAVAPYSPLFVEDPIQIDSNASQARLARSTQLTLGQGERLLSAWEVRELLEAGGPQVIRSDIALAGGISHAMKMAAVAESFSSKVSWHTFSGPIASAAATHVDLVIPNMITQEWWAPLDEPGRLGGFTSSLHREGGWMLPSIEPGLGVDFEETSFEPFEILGRPIQENHRGFDGSVGYLN